MTRQEVILKVLLDSFAPEFSVMSDTEFGVEGIVDFAALARDIEAAIAAAEQQPDASQ